MKSRRKSLIIWAFAFVIVLLLVAETTAHKPVDWSLSYTSYDKIPYGTHVFYNELPNLLQAKIQRITSDPFQFLSETGPKTKDVYVFINDILTFDDQQSKQLMDFAAKGNTVFIAANSISGALNANLDFTVTGKRNLLKQKVSVNFFNPRLKTTTAVVFHEHYPTHFDQINPNATALSFLTLDDDEEPKINFISIPHGEGKFLIHTTPEAFSNFNLLHENQEYAAAAMSYVNAEKIYWDEYIKSGRRFISSPLRFILGNQALTWSYYLVMSGLFLFVLFQGKRQQRPIPIIEPQKNSSVEFTKTVGSLYFQHRDFSN